jgi:hypothetical protein
MTRYRFLAVSAAITVLHAVVTFASIAIAFTRGMRRFDSPALRETYLERVCNVVASIFMQPSAKILTALGAMPRTSVLEWSVLLLNSLLWGLMIALLVGRLSARRKQFAA